MNAETSVDWLPALVILGAGLVLGAVLVWRLLVISRAAPRKVAPRDGASRKIISRGAVSRSAASRSAVSRSAVSRSAVSGSAVKAATGLPPVELRDLAGRSEALLRQLRELEDTASKRTPEQLARERYALELEAAQGLLALEERGMFEAPSPASGEIGPATHGHEGAPEPRDRAGMRGFLWGTGSATGLLLLGFFVYQSAQPRSAGGSVTGNTPMSERPAGTAASDGPQAPDADEVQLKAAVARNPDDADSHLALARLYIEKQNWMGIWTETGKVLERAPGNPRALAYQSLVRLQIGQTEAAVTMLTKALAADPDLVDAYAYLALAYSQTGRMKDAEGTIAKAAKRFPDHAAELRQYLADLNGRDSPAAKRGAGSGTPDPHAGLGLPEDGVAPKSGTSGRSATSAQSAPTGRSTTTGRSVSGTVDLDPVLKGKMPPGGILFVFARAAGASEGPPVAVKRLPARFPATFQLSEADSMMGQPLPDPLLIEARLDEDGDPTTRPPSDPKARLDGVKVGTADVLLILKRP